MTGATHARELISTTQNLYEIMKLIKLGWIEQDPEELKLLNQNRFLFMPILNVDGVALIEQYWQENHRILRKRKNQDQTYGLCENSQIVGEDTGVDINRNFGVDFGQVEDIEGAKRRNREKRERGLPVLKEAMTTDPCDYNFPGSEPFSEPETKAFRDFLIKNKEDLSFVINMHSNGNSFVYPFNGRDENDIEERRPGILGIFTQISKEAPFTPGTEKGTSKKVMGITVGGD